MGPPGEPLPYDITGHYVPPSNNEVALKISDSLFFEWAVQSAACSALNELIPMLRIGNIKKR